MEHIFTKTNANIRHHFIIYTSLHLCIIYLFQLEVFQNHLAPDSTLARISGIRKMIIHGSCPHQTWKISVNHELTSQGKWPSFLQPFFIFAVHYCCAQAKRIYDEYEEVRKLGTNRPKVKPQTVTSNAMNTSMASNRTDRSYKRNSSMKIFEKTTQITNNINDYSDKALRSVSSKFIALLMFVRSKALWAIGLVTMMTWAATFHSLQTFILLIWSIFLWWCDDREQRTLKHSPALALYSFALVVGQFIYSLDLTEEELPECINGNITAIGNTTRTYCSQDTVINMKLIGFNRNPSVSDSFQTLGGKLSFTIIFLFLLREYNRQIIFEKNNQNTEKKYIDHVANIFGTDSAPAKAAKYIMELSAKYWVVILYAFQLSIGFSGRIEVTKLVYICTFLVQTILFQLDWSTWRNSLVIFWKWLVFYSTLVVMLTYSYQFQDVYDFFNKTNTTESINPAIWEALGLQKYESGATLMLKIFIPTMFLFVCLLQRHVFHNEFMSLTAEVQYMRKEKRIKASKSASKSSFGKSMDRPTNFLTEEAKPLIENSQKLQGDHF